MDFLDDRLYISLAFLDSAKSPLRIIVSTHTDPNKRELRASSWPFLYTSTLQYSWLGSHPSMSSHLLSEDSGMNWIDCVGGNRSKDLGRKDEDPQPSRSKVKQRGQGNMKT